MKPESCSPGNSQVKWDRDFGADYYYDAIRAPWRLALSAAWDCDERALEQAALLAAFFRGKGPWGIQHGFTVDGTSLGDEGNSSCFIATAATAMIPGPFFSNGGTAAGVNSPLVVGGTIESWWGATVDSADDDAGYFCSTLRLLSLFFQAGLFTRPVAVSA